MVYVLKCQGFFKIGKATNLKKRLSSIRTSSPFDIELFTTLDFSDEDSHDVEQGLHGLFKGRGKHKRGEWFDLDEHEQSFLKEASRLLKEGRGEMNFFQYLANLFTKINGKETTEKEAETFYRSLYR